MNGSDSESPPNPERTSLPLSLDDVEAALCGTATPEQRARYCAAMNDPDSELNAMLTHIRSSETNVLNQSMPYPSRHLQRKRRRRQSTSHTTNKASIGDQTAEVPYAVALGENSKAGGYKKVFKFAPEQCVWKPSRPQSLAEQEGRITVSATETGMLKITVGGFLFDSDEYQLEAAWFAADMTELARAKPDNAFVPQVSLTPRPSRPLELDGELQITSVYEPKEGIGWTAMVRVRLG